MTETKTAPYDLHFNSRLVVPMTYRGMDFLEAPHEHTSQKDICETAISAGLRVSFETTDLRDRLTQ